MSVRITVNEYTAHISAGTTILVPTFRDGERFSYRGTVTAPDGTTVYQGSTSRVPQLKVPKPGRRAEFWLLNAEEAINLAAAGDHGLSWEPAHQGVLP